MAGVRIYLFEMVGMWIIPLFVAGGVVVVAVLVRIICRSVLMWRVEIRT